MGHIVQNWKSYWNLIGFFLTLAFNIYIYIYTHTIGINITNKIVAEFSLKVIVEYTVITTIPSVRI